MPGEAPCVCGVHPCRYDETLFSTELAVASAAMLLCGYSYSYSLQSSLTGVRIGWLAVGRCGGATACFVLARIGSDETLFFLICARACSVAAWRFIHSYSLQSSLTPSVFRLSVCMSVLSIRAAPQALSAIASSLVLVRPSLPFAAAGSPEDEAADAL